MQKQGSDQPAESVDKTTEQARQGVTGHNVRYVLLLSTIGSGIALVVLLFLFVM